MTDTLRIVLVDDHDRVRSALLDRLQHVPGVLVLAAVGDVPSAIHHLTYLKADLVLFEPRTVPSSDSLPLPSLVASGVPVVVWTSSLTGDEAESYIQAGAAAVLLKDANIPRLVATLVEIIA
jgi:DNA-binding NarL/FixJ family response regulator